MAMILASSWRSSTRQRSRSPRLAVAAPAVIRRPSDPANAASLALHPLSLDQRSNPAKCAASGHPRCHRISDPIPPWRPARRLSSEQSDPAIRAASHDLHRSSFTNFTVDIRAIDDEVREAIVLEFSNQVHRTCDDRMVNCTVQRKHNADAVHCDSGLTMLLKQAAQSATDKMMGKIQGGVPVLMSGAGHDAMAMSHLTKVGMLFVRCKGGISHSPEEHVLEDDVWAAGLALLHFVDQNAVSNKMTILQEYCIDEEISTKIQVIC